MQPKAPFWAAVVSLATCLVPIACGAENGKGYVYDATATGDNGALVVDRVNRWVEVQDKANVRIGAMLTDLGGG